MAERTISTRLIISGEQEYRSAIKGINRDLKELDSQIKLVDSEYQGQQNTLAALQARHDALSNAIEKQAQKLKTERDAQKQARDLMWEYAEAAEKTRGELNQLVRDTDDITAETKEYQQKVSELSAKLKDYEDATRKSANAAQEHATKANQAEAQLNELNRELSQNDKYLDEARNSADQCAKSIDAYGKEAKDAAEDTDKLDKSSRGWVETMKGVLSADMIKNGLQHIWEGLKACVDASVEFESAMAGVQKTTGMSDTEVAAMGDAIQEMSTRIPLAATEIAALVEAGGQLGIAQEDLLGFAEVMANMAVATDLTSEEAATALAQLANIMGTAASDYERMGSTIVALGNAGASTESQIVEMAQRLAGAGATVGMTESEVLALASTLASLGINAEAGGGSVSRLLNKLETLVSTGSPKLEDFASVAGMSAEEFASAWNEDAMGTLALFVEGLSGVEESGGSAIAVLNELGITETQMTDALLRMANGGTMLSDSLEMANEAWRENSALAEEAATRYSTTESQMQLFNNSVTNFKTAVGDALSPLLNNLMDAGSAALEWATNVISGSNTLTDQINAIDTDYEAEADALSTTAAQASALVDMLEEIESTSGGAAEGSDEWNAVLAKLCETVPELSGLINQQTGEIEGGTEALRDQIAAWEENALEQAKAAALQEKYNAYVAAQEELFEKQVELEMELAKYEEDRANAADSFQNANIWGRMFGTEETREMAESNARVAELRGELAELEEQLEANKEVYNAYSEALGEVADTSQGAADASNEMTAAQQAQAEAYNALISDMDALIAAQEEAKAAAMEQVESVVGGFGEMEEVAAQSIEDTIAALQSQIDYMDTYAAALELVMERGVDMGIVAQLADGTQESLSILLGLVEASDEQIADFVATFDETQKAKDTLATNMADAKTDFDTEADAIAARTVELVNEMNQTSQAYDNGAATIGGYIDGLNSRLSELDIVSEKIQSLMAGGASDSNSGSSSSSGGRTGGRGFYATAHAAGLAYVPSDGYLAELHEGEMVLTRLQAEAYRAERLSGVRAQRAASQTVTNNARFGDIIIQMGGQSGADGRKIAAELRRELRLRGVYAG